MSLLNQFKNKKHCSYCNFLPAYCNCPLVTQKGNKNIKSIKERIIKNKLWVTEIEGSISILDFKCIKSKLGTGGLYEPQKVQVRGKVAERVSKLLLTLGYTVS